jgi:hypothetical protein
MIGCGGVGAADGKTRATVVPWPGRLVRSSSPPCSSARRRVVALAASVFHCAGATGLEARLGVRFCPYHHFEAETGPDQAAEVGKEITEAVVAAHQAITGIEQGDAFLQRIEDRIHW